MIGFLGFVTHRSNLYAIMSFSGESLPSMRTGDARFMSPEALQVDTPTVPQFVNHSYQCAIRGENRDTRKAKWGTGLAVR